MILNWSCVLYLGELFGNTNQVYTSKSRAVSVSTILPTTVVATLCTYIFLSSGSSKSLVVPVQKELVILHVRKRYLLWFDSRGIKINGTQRIAAFYKHYRLK